MQIISCTYLITVNFKKNLLESLRKLARHGKKGLGDNVITGKKSKANAGGSVHQRPLHVTAVCSDATASLIETLELLDEYNGIITAPTARLWIMYMDMVMIMKQFIHAKRAGLWDEHLAEVEKMMPYLVAAGHHKYVSCLSHYLDAMRVLPVFLPNIVEAFREGQFTVRRCSGRYNGV